MSRIAQLQELHGYTSRGLEMTTVRQVSGVNTYIYLIINLPTTRGGGSLTYTRNATTDDTHFY